jgi:hypothetical protein
LEGKEEVGGGRGDWEERGEMLGRCVREGRGGRAERGKRAERNGGEKSEEERE